MIRAAIDCGTNSLRLLVRDGDRVLVRTERVVRLGEGVDATRRFSPSALGRVFAALDEYATVLGDVGAASVRVGATSAAREAENVAELAAGVRSRFGADLEVLSGAQEAELTFAGALIGPAVDGPVLVTDIGGGSTEIVLGRPDGTIEYAASLDIGAVRLRERFLRNDPPHTDELAAATAFVDAQLDTAALEWAGVRTWIGVAGTFTTLAALVQNLDRYDPAAVSGTLLTRGDRDRELARCLRTPAAGLTSAVVPAARAEVIAGGALIISALARRLDERPVLVRDSDLLDGILGGPSVAAGR